MLTDGRTFLRIGQMHLAETDIIFVVIKHLVRCTGHPKLDVVHLESSCVSWNGPTESNWSRVRTSIGVEGGEREGKSERMRKKKRVHVAVCVCICLDLKDDCRRKINAVMHLANCSYTTDTHFSPLLVSVMWPSVAIVFRHRFALDKSNFMASDLFNLILSIEFLQRFSDRKLCGIDCVYECMWHMLCCLDRITNSQKTNATTSLFLPP